MIQVSFWWISHLGNFSVHYCQRASSSNFMNWHVELASNLPTLNELGQIFVAQLIRLGDQLNILDLFLPSSISSYSVILSSLSGSPNTLSISFASSVFPISARIIREGGASDLLAVLIGRVDVNKYRLV